MNTFEKLLGTLVVGAVLTLTPKAEAASIAVFGDNSIDNYLAGLGYTATLVSDAQLATAGFLSSFDAFFMTRDGSSFGSGLSAAATANVASFVGASGNVVLLNADFADSVPSDGTINTLVANAVAYAVASGNGFIGEFNGAVAALTANGNSFNPIGLIPGTAGALGGGAGGSSGAIYKTLAGAVNPVTSGLPDGYNPLAVEYGATMSGVPAAMVMATWGVGGNPAVVVRAGAAVPEAGSTLALLLMVVGATGWMRRRA